MAIRITGLNELRERLERLRPEEVMARALAEQAERMAAPSKRPSPFRPSGRSAKGAGAGGLRGAAGWWRAR